MAKKRFVVTGDDRDVINRRFEDIMRQLRLKKGSPLDPELVKIALQMIDERTFSVVKNILSKVVYSSHVWKRNYFWLISEKFVENERKDANVKISTITSEFKKHFFGLLGETDPHYFIKARILRNTSSTYQIISEIKKEKGGTFDGSLSGIYVLMEKNCRDLFIHSGFKLEGLSMENNNIFFAKSSSSEMRQIILRWFKVGWIVDSKPLEEEIEPGSRIFYCIKG
jgi:hypothetical protein